MQQDHTGDDGILAPGQQLCFAVYSAAHAFNRAYKPVLDALGLTYPQYLVMLVLWQGDQRTVKAIGAELGLDSGTLSPLLKRLEAAGIVSRTRDRDDERQVIVSLTERGTSMKQEAFRIFSVIGNAIGCSAQQAEALRTALQDLAARLDGASAKG